MGATGFRSDERGIGAADVRSLCAWLRSGYRADATHVPIQPTVAGYAQLPWAEVAALLLGVARCAERGGTIATEDVDVWDAVYGVTAAPMAIADICAATGYGPHILRRRVRRVEAEVAARLRARPGTESGRPGSAHPSPSATHDPVAVEEATALVHARAAVDRSRSDQLAQLERRDPVVGRPVPRTPRERKSAERTRQRVAAAISRELDRRTTSALANGGPQFLDVDAAAADGRLREDAAGSSGRRTPDLDALRALVDGVERGIVARDPALFEWVRTASRGFAQFLTPLDPITEARLWGVRASLWREEESLKSVWAAQRIVRLVGDAHPLLVGASSDAAIVLRAHGYLGAAHRWALRGLALAQPAAADPISNVSRRASLLTVVASISRLQVACGTAGRLERLEDALLRACAQCEERPAPSTLAWLPLLYRRLGQLQLARGTAALPSTPGSNLDRAAAGRAERWFARSARWTAMLHGPPGRASAITRVHSSPTGAVVHLGHDLVTMRLMLELGDADGYLDAAGSFGSLWAAEPWYPNFGNDYRLLSDAAIHRRRWAKAGELPELAAVASGRDWFAIDTPPPGSPRRRRLPTI